MKTKQKKYVITEDALTKAVIICTKKLMKGQRNWKRDPNLSLLEYNIEKGIINELSKISVIELEK